MMTPLHVGSSNPLDHRSSQNHQLGSSNPLEHRPSQNHQLGCSNPLECNLPQSHQQVSALPAYERNNNSVVGRGTAENDYLQGGNGNDTLYGLAGNDILCGGGGNDTLKGGAGIDRLFGGAGNDTLIDYDGGDTLTGGTGADQFWVDGWDAPATPTKITDFEVGVDKVKIGRLGATFDNLAIQDTSNGAAISDRGNVVALLQCVSATSLTLNDIIFGDSAKANDLQTQLENHAKSIGSPGETDAVITPEGFTWQGATGFSDLLNKTPMQPDDEFRVASITKAFTATTMLKLAEQGTLSLDDTLGKWLPKVATNIPGGQDITIRQILNGSSGIAEYTEDQKFRDEALADAVQSALGGQPRTWKPEELVSYIYGQPRYADKQYPGWVYPNTGNILAGLVIEQATGKTYAQVLREQVIEPLGLKNTYLAGYEPAQGNQVRGYADVITQAGTEGQDGVIEDVTNQNPTQAWANYGLTSTAQDIARFGNSLFSGELVSRNSLDQMLTFVPGGANYESSSQSGYGLGVAGGEDKVAGGEGELGRRWGKVGSIPGYESQLDYFPDQGGATKVTLNNGFSIPESPTLNPLQLVSVKPQEVKPT